jgi:Domain of unknown function (DUF4136)
MTDLWSIDGSRGEAVTVGARQGSVDARRFVRTTGVTLIAATLALSGCYPDDIVDEGDFDTVATFFAPEANFSTITRYALIDSVVQVPDSGRNVSSPSFNSAVISAVRENLNALGWTEVVRPPDISAVDVVVTLAITSSTTFVLQSWWSYWGWWGYWPPYWGTYGWWYPYYPVTVYSYEVGTLILTMVDARTARDADQQIPVAWTAFLRGIVEDQVANTARAVASIDQAFAQSPYLTAGTAASRSR